MKFFLCVIGMVFFIEGLPWFGFPEKVKETMAQLSQTPGPFMRRIGFMMMFAGLVLVYVGKH